MCIYKVRGGGEREREREKEKESERKGVELGRERETE